MRRVVFAAGLCLGLSTGAIAADKAPVVVTPAPPEPPSASAIAYELPSTSIKIAIGLTLTKCVGDFTVKPDITFTPAAGPSEHKEWKFALDGRNLSSFWKSKKLTLETYPSGAIKSLNGGLSDQTGSIITSVVKIAASLIALSPSNLAPATLAGKCSTEVVDALARVNAMKTRIAALRVQLETAQPGQIEGIAKTVDALAAEVARLQTAELHIDLPAKEYVLDQGIDGAVLGWNSSTFKKWLKKDTPDFPVDKLAIGLCFRPAAVTEGEAALHCTADTVRTASKVSVALAAISCPDDADCSETLVLREPAKATVTAIAEGTGFDGTATDGELKRADLMVAQWGPPSYLSLKVGFGKSINFAMGFDEYGHKTSQTWDSAARGASILGTASAVTDSAAGIYKSIDGRQLAEDKAEIDRISTEKALNQARFCKAVYDAGGGACP